MKIYDMHIHMRSFESSPEAQLKRMDEAGIFGGCVFSIRPKEMNPKTGLDFEERLNQVLDWCRPFPDRLFPVLWIHPFEEDILKKVHIAAERGIAAFKIICNNFFIYEEKCLEVLKEIAKLNKPVIFHSGILWDGEVSSKFNRPINFEALINIEGLRFSLGHCSWPWIDECIALYGKFQNALGYKNTAEMFFDITPGTPENYRKDLMDKLFLTGYDVGSNILFGMDSCANAYNPEWSKKWLEIDRDLMDELGVSKKIRENLYYNNLMRFLGLSGEKGEIKPPVPDNSNKVLATNSEVPKIIEEWYKKLKMPKEYDGEFYDALKAIPISDAIHVDYYNKASKNGERNLLSFLYFCEELEKRYKEKGIPEEILLDTLADIRRWLITHSNLQNKLYLGELHWLSFHLSMRLFKLGRLQFMLNGAERDIPKYNIKKGDPIIEVHIPSDGKLDEKECRESFQMAYAFYEKYFPEIKPIGFTCHSWLLDTELKNHLPKESNILKFQSLFDIIHEDESNALLGYIFKWNTTVLNLKHEIPEGDFAKRIKSAALSGTKFHESLGFIKY